MNKLFFFWNLRVKPSSSNSDRFVTEPINKPYFCINQIELGASSPLNRPVWFGSENLEKNKQNRSNAQERREETKPPKERDSSRRGWH